MTSLTYSVSSGSGGDIGIDGPIGDKEHWLLWQRTQVQLPAPRKEATNLLILQQGDDRGTVTGPGKEKWGLCPLHSLAFQLRGSAAASEAGSISLG